MEFDDLVMSRRSVRGYRKQPVPRELIDEILEVAKGAPSSMNTQPWHVHVLTGAPLDEVRRRNTEEMLAGKGVHREITLNHGYEGKHRFRQVEIAKQLFAVMGIERDDKERRQDWVMRGFRQFDAPVSVVLTFDRELADCTVAHFDLGALSYGIVLAAWSRGLGTVINGQGIMRSDIVREVAKIPENEVIMTCIAMGWPDGEFAANGVKAHREPNESFVSYVGFEG
ncbi:MAG: nitroreductase [Pseudomonadota bacterium]|nr:nitroreductase [Pseudomonadota bacterium]